MDRRPLCRLPVPRRTGLPGCMLGRLLSAREQLLLCSMGSIGGCESDNVVHYSVVASLAPCYASSPCGHRAGGEAHLAEGYAPLPRVSL